MSFFDDLRNLDRNNVGGWPKSIKTFFAVLIFAVILLAGWWFKIRDQQADLERQQAKEQTLKKEFSEKQQKVVNLDAYRKQLEDMKEMLRTMLRQLPSKTEMPTSSSTFRRLRSRPASSSICSSPARKSSRSSTPRSRSS